VVFDRSKEPEKAALETVLDKLAPEDRKLVREALASAEKTEAELRYLAEHDSLTGLLDRLRFRAELDQYVSFSARYGGQGAVMIIDIDGLKAVNDSLGHHAGDNLIREIARILRERIRTTDIAARLSGDEFAVLMPQTDIEGATQLGEDLRAQVAESARPMPEADCATVSVGITLFGGRHAAGPEAVLVAADQAMYRAKEGGRNQIAVFHDPNQPQRSPRPARTTSARIRDALTHDRLSLHTQPIRDLASGGIERYELLLRMTGDNGELLPASSFIEVAERSGMVQELDRWVVARALKLLGEREREGRPVSLHVNLSPWTHHMLNAETFALCKRGALIINTARGRLIETDALRAALDSGQISGAGLDVLEEERVMRQPASTVMTEQILQHLHSDSEQVPTRRNLHDLDRIMQSHALLAREVHQHPFDDEVHA